MDDSFERNLTFGDNAQIDLDRIEDLINLAEAATTLKPIEASIHRLYIAACRDPTTRMNDRLKAVDALAKLQGLFVDRVRTELDVPQDMPTAKLLTKLADKLGLKGLQMNDFGDLANSSGGAILIDRKDLKLPDKIKTLEEDEYFAE